MIARAAPTTSPVFASFAEAGTYSRPGGGASAGSADGVGRCGGQGYAQKGRGTEEKMNVNEDKKILDVTCGIRSIWFNKHHPAAIYCDKRAEDYDLYFGKNHTSLHHCHVEPDVQCDFTELPFPDESFSLVVFDPPHLTRAKETAWLVKKYGRLNEDWPKMLHDGFTECMRVLKRDGILIFKWSEYDIPANDVWKAIGQKPLFGHHSGKKSTTFWGCFMKGEV